MRPTIQKIVLTATFVAVVGGPYLAEGEAAVIEPRGKDGFRVVARIRKDEWAQLGPP